MARMITVSLFISVLLTQQGYAQEDPFNGSWRLNVEKSKMQPRTFSKSETVVYRVSDNTEIYTSDVITGDGEHEVTQYNARYSDGKEFPSTVTVKPGVAAGKFNVTMPAVAVVAVPCELVTP